MTKRTITLTGRPPVSINDDQWPMIASASDKSFDNQYEFQANRISKWFIGVRQHKDGRAIVYAVYSYDSQWANDRNMEAKAGVLLESNSDIRDICDAIREVVSEISSREHDGNDESRWQSLQDAVIADLPAEEL